MISKLDLGYVHGSCVDFDGKSILCVGASGTGKTSLALQLIALGGTLVSDDQVVLTAEETGIYVSAPPTIEGQIEVRNIGILNCPNVKRSRLNLIVDMALEVSERLPVPKTIEVGSHHVNLIAGCNVANLPIAAQILNLYGYSHELDGFL